MCVFVHVDGAALHVSFALSTSRIYDMYVCYMYVCIHICWWYDTLHMSFARIAGRILHNWIMYFFLNFCIPYLLMYYLPYCSRSARVLWTRLRSYTPYFTDLFVAVPTYSLLYWCILYCMYIFLNCMMYSLLYWCIPYFTHFFPLLFCRLHSRHIVVNFYYVFFIYSLSLSFCLVFSPFSLPLYIHRLNTYGCISIYIHIYIYIYIFMYLYVFTCIDKYIYIYMHVFIYIYIHECMTDLYMCLYVVNIHIHM